MMIDRWMIDRSIDRSIDKAETEIELNSQYPYDILPLLTKH